MQFKTYDKYGVSKGVQINKYKDCQYQKRNSKIPSDEEL